MRICPVGRAALPTPTMSRSLPGQIRRTSRRPPPSLRGGQSPTWQSVTPAAQRAARPQWGRRDADCHGPVGPRNDVVICGRSVCTFPSLLGGGGTAHRPFPTVSMEHFCKIVGAIHESPAAPLGAAKRARFRVPFVFH